MKTKIKLSLVLSSVIGIALSAFMIFCYLNYVDPYTLLVNPSIVVTVFSGLCAVSVIFALILPRFTVGKCDVSGETHNTSFVIFSASLLGFLFAGYVFHALVSPIRGMLGTSNMPYADVASFGKLLRILYIFGAVLAIPSAVYFIIIALRKNIGKSSALSLLAVCPVLFCAVRLIYTFMQSAARVNSAGRKITIVALSLCVFFFLYEAILLAPKGREENDEKTAVKSSLRFLGVGYAAIIALFVSQLSTTLLQAFWLIEVNDTYIMNGIFITMILYIAARISSLNVTKIQ